jgi:small subunit ribosomal protein S16
MLTIRMQRTGRKGHAMFRVVVQDSRRTPSSGKVVALIGSYDPHSKSSNLDKEKAKFYLDHGSQPSTRAARLLKSEGVDLPSWVKIETKDSRTIRNPEKLRRNRPDEPETPASATEAEAPAEEPAVDTIVPEETEAPEAETTAEPEVQAEATEEATPDEEAPAAESTEPETPTEAEEPANKAVEQAK